MEENFKAKLKRDIIRRFSILAVLMTAVLLGLFIFFSVAPQQYDLESDARTIQTQYKHLLVKHDQMMKGLNKGEVLGYLNHQVNERYLYRKFYEERTKLGVRSELLVFDSAAHLSFSTDNQTATNLTRSSYFKIVMSKMSANQPVTKYILDEDGNHYLAFIRPVVDHNVTKGYSVVLINGNDFIQAVQNINSKFIIADRYDNVFTANREEFIEGQLRKINRQVFDRKLKVYEGKVFISYTGRLDDAGTLYAYRNLVPISVVIMYSILLSLVLLGLLICQSRSLADKIATKNSESINQLVEEMNQITLQQQQKIHMETDDEFEYLADKINGMLWQLTYLNHHNLQLEKERGIFERRMLEAQFNPHFLYNTLETIKVTSQFDAVLTEKIIMLLTKVLRYSLNHLDQLSTLADDMSVLESYLEINKIRFEELTYDIQVDPSLEKLEVPKLFLLPVIENAIKYGYRHRRDLAILVQVQRQADCIEFRVRDNGPGIDREQRLQILNNKHSAETYHGLVNSYRRVASVFDQVDFVFEEVNQGTSIVFRVKEGLSCTNY